jgi:hypothetical protein
MKIKIADAEAQVKSTANGKTYTTFRFTLEGKEEPQVGTVWDDVSSFLKENKGKEVECEATYNEQYKNYNVRFQKAGRAPYTGARSGGTSYGNAYKGEPIPERKYLDHLAGYFKYLFPKILEGVVSGLGGSTTAPVTINEVVVCQLIQSAEKMAIAAAIAVGQNVIKVGDKE